MESQSKFNVLPDKTRFKKNDENASQKKFIVKIIAKIYASNSKNKVDNKRLKCAYLRSRQRASLLPTKSTSTIGVSNNRSSQI